MAFLAALLLPVLLVLLVLLVLSVPVGVRAQPGFVSATNGWRYQVRTNDVTVRGWSIEQGLPQSSVLSLASDGDGYLWGGTFGGLFRFDGRDVLGWTERELPELSMNSVTAVHGAPDGTVWVGTAGGTVARLRGGRLLDALPPLPAAMRGVIDALQHDADGTLWVTVAEKLHGYRAGRWRTMPLKDKVNGRLAGDARGRVWLLTERGLVRLEHGRAVLTVPSPDTLLDYERAVHVSPQGEVWFGSSRGVVRYDGKRAVLVSSTPANAGVVTVDTDGNAWVSSDSTLYRLVSAGGTGKSMRAISIVNAGGMIVALTWSHDGQLVVGSLSGLLVVRKNIVTVYPFPNPRHRAVASMAVAPDGESVWVTSGCTKAYRLSRAGSSIDSMAAPGSGCTYSLLVDRRQRLWAGGDGVIRRRDGAGREKEWDLASLGLAEAKVRPLLMHGDTLFFGLDDGRIGRIGPSGNVDLDPRWRTATNRPIESMARAGDGTLWIGQAGRISRRRDDALESFGQEAAIPGAVPRVLLPDDRGGVWVGTYGSGLLHFPPGGRARVAPLPDPAVSSILPDGAGKVWMSGNLGLTVVPSASLDRWLADSTSRPEFRVLSAQQGAPEGNFGSPAAIRMEPGALAFASVSGMVVARRDAVVPLGRTPPVRIDAVRTPRGDRPLDGHPLLLGADERTLQVTFSVPSFAAPDEVQFRYRVDGRDAVWLPIGQRELRLAGLQPGTYALQIEARVPGDEWRAAEQALVLDVTPLFSERRWPRLVLLLMVIGVVTSFYQLRLNALTAQARAREIREQADRAAAALAEQHRREMAQVGRVAVAGELTASISHELGQPLTAIVNNAEVARRLLVRTTGDGAAPHEDAHVDPRVEQALLDVVAQGRRASQVVREFRRFLKRERGERECIAVRELIESATVLLQREFGEHDVSLQLSVAPDTPSLEAERVLLQQVLVNLLSNALDATRHLTEGQVLVRARRSGDGVRVSVVDNGAGFAVDVRGTAFDPFVTTREHGMGMGLAIARRVVDAHGGHIAAGRLPSAGAVVSFWLPTSHAPLDRSDGLVPLQVTAQ